MCISSSYIHGVLVSVLQSPDETAEVLESSSSSGDDELEGDSDNLHEKQLPNKLVQEAKRTSRFTQAFPGEDSDGTDTSSEGDETSAEAGLPGN